MAAFDTGLQDHLVPNCYEACLSERHDKLASLIIMAKLTLNVVWLDATFLMIRIQDILYQQTDGTIYRRPFSILT